MGEDSREMYDYSYDGNIITIIIGKERDMFEGEGIHQHVELLINLEVIYSTNFGREHTLNMFDKKQDYIFFDINMILFKNNELHLHVEKDEYIIFNNDDYKLFMNWVYECLTPITTKRKFKIDKLKSIIKEKNVL